MCTSVHIFVTKWCIVEYLSNALCDLWDGFSGLIDNTSLHGSGNVLVTLRNKQQVIALTNDGPVYWHVIAPPPAGLRE